MTLSAAAMIEAEKESSGVPWLILVTVDSPEVEAPYRFAMNTEDFVSRGETYQSLWMDVQLASDREDQPPRALIRIDAIDRLMIEALENLTEPATVSLEVVIATEPDTVQHGQYGLTLAGFSYTHESIDADLEGPSILDETYPGVSMNKANFPGLYRS